MNRVRSTIGVAALAVVTLVGAGACALDPQADPAGDDLAAVSVSGGLSGERASPGSDQLTAPIPARKATATLGTTRTTVQTTSNKTTASSTCPQGEYQRAVETYLAKLGTFGKVIVDGKQSATDCAAIKKFQQRYDIRPVQGRAGPTTHDVSKRLATTNVKSCKTGSGVTFCIDLTRQTTWAMRDGKVVIPPTVTRTGMRGYATPTGTYKINKRNIKEWSNPYEVWLPYWQRFVGGIGYHQTTTYLHDKSIGSHGCINLLPADAKRFWDWGKVGYRVVVFGRRPGT
ncbi:L,D-transpeptidase family protein [Micromonospora inyonensis]|uniref:L,D-transpeptidase catalytic domain n=1 Tax=Micromonospora inyonensis TaxID=47866 RepID=A0A1C6RIV8_9ACTN|nr:L,D-transpeptidase family protein [Micromonospora inyonensis]SCL17119.1 L,D-transpeptidase catalytic domain [Micromonospora inyonensis]